MAWAVSGSDIGAVIGVGYDTTWAGQCADAVNSAYTTRLNGYSPATSSDAEKELKRSALLDGVEAYKDRDARYGLQSVGPDGDVIRVGFDVIRAGRAAIDRYALPGVG